MTKKQPPKSVCSLVAALIAWVLNVKFIFHSSFSLIDLIALPGACRTSPTRSFLFFLLFLWGSLQTWSSTFTETQSQTSTPPTVTAVTDTPDSQVSALGPCSTWRAILPITRRADNTPGSPDSTSNLTCSSSTLSVCHWHLPSLRKHYKSSGGLSQTMKCDPCFAGCYKTFHKDWDTHSKCWISLN